MKIRVLELYSGIGGMHFALLESRIEAEIICAIDINTTANAVYKLNFPQYQLMGKNIKSLTEDNINDLEVDMILMSPPCQPHSRNGLKKDELDKRSDSLLHIISLFSKLKTVKYVLLENVKGFETSTVRNELLLALQQSNFEFQEFLLSPTQFAIPNSRLRYYLLAKKRPLNFCFEKTDFVMEKLPKLTDEVEKAVYELNLKYRKLCSTDSCFKIGLVLENTDSYFIPSKILWKYGTLFDIVTKESVRSCCFTKGYSHFVEGTGSVLSLKDNDTISRVFKELKEYSNKTDKFSNLLKSLQLRYFTPNEISALMCFPKCFVFPSTLSDKQKFRLLGNSINVHVVAILIKILIS